MDKGFDNTLVIPDELLSKIKNIARCQEIQIIKNIKLLLDNKNIK